ncbi:sialidase family protein [Globicatella sanguinis]|uniref:sialidase family protein n=1 Tax=Globicatella sanguinis TaxID=13076 RepID=UPI002543CFA6|nr:sialidase family protein [Globicatella sanguinis]MDK7630503.1 sialidase family protein [Globicatella sanguinis]WIK66241.1 sialidase family protein [Globicatella sanguinis]WKT55646.1 sialidase family protein [Globicatella sanguinis]
MIKNKPKIIFESGKHGQKNKTEDVYCYRIPALLTTMSGTVIAGADQRYDHHFDWGNIDMVIKRSEDEGETWSEIIKICDLPTNPNSIHPDYGSAFNIDMCLVQDPKTQRIFSIFDMFTEQRGCFGIFEDNFEKAYQEINGKDYLIVYENNEESKVFGTIRENGIIYDNEGNVTAYRVITESKQAPYNNLGNLYKSEELIGNVYFRDPMNPLRIAKNMYVWLSYSDDDGKTWSCPEDITPQIKLPWMVFYGVGPGNGIALHAGEKKGRLIIPMYSTNSLTTLDGSQTSRVIYSDDHGKTWNSGLSVNDNRYVPELSTTIDSKTFDNRLLQNTEAVAVQLNNGQVKLFMRNLTGNVQVATSFDGGETWHEEISSIKEIVDVYVQLSAIHTIQDGKEYVLLTNATGPERNNGHVHILEVTEEGNLKWLNKILIQEGKFAYNSIQMLNDKTFGVLYEHSSQEYNEYCLLFNKFNWSELEILLDEQTKN